MNYPLQSMLKIRVMREDRAGTALTSARRARKLAADELETRRRERAEYQATKEERRDRIFAQVMGRPVGLDALDDVRTAVTRIDEEGVLLERAEQEAEDVLKQKVHAAESARVVFVGASRNRMKIDEHRKIWTAEMRIEEERAADAEMEEFTGKKGNVE